MFKKYKKQLIISSIVILLPILIGVLLWDQLPDSFTTHWGVDGQPDGWSSKTFAVFFIPVFLVVMQFFCVWITERTNRGNEQSPKVMNLIFYIMPVLSVLVNGMMYAGALGKSWDWTAMMPIVLGLLFAIIGNYMPKCKQNYTIGIKIPWTLNSEENWSRTHRFAGWLWTFCGIALMLTGIIGGFWIFLFVVLLMVFAPILYSYLLFRKGI